MSRHYLTQIDRVTRTAVCSVCGPTEVHVSRPRTGNPTRVCCVQRAREGQEKIYAWKQQHKSPGRPRHSIKEINEGNRSAVCAICGSTDVYRTRAKGKLVYRCATHVRALGRQERGAHIVNPCTRVHILSEIDEEKRTAVCAKCGPVWIIWDPSGFSAAGHPGAILGSGSPRFKYGRAQEDSTIVTEYKRRQACKRCGTMAVLAPGRFHFFEMHLPQEQRISVLLETAGPEELATKFEKRDLYCNPCLDLVMHAFASNTPIPEFRPFPAFF